MTSKVSRKKYVPAVVSESKFFREGYRQLKLATTAAEKFNEAKKQSKRLAHDIQYTKAQIVKAEKEFKETAVKVTATYLSIPYVTPAIQDEDDPLVQTRTATVVVSTREKAYKDFKEIVLDAVKNYERKELPHESYNIRDIKDLKIVSIDYEPEVEEVEQALTEFWDYKYAVDELPSMETKFAITVDKLRNMGKRLRKLPWKLQKWFDDAQEANVKVNLFVSPHNNQLHMHFDGSCVKFAIDFGTEKEVVDKLGINHLLGVPRKRYLPMAEQDSYAQWKKDEANKVELEAIGLAQLLMKPVAVEA